MTDLAALTLESLEVGGSPVVREVLRRLQLQSFFERFLPAADTGAPEKVATAVTLTALVGHLLLCREPLYAMPEWFARRVPEHLGLTAQQLPLLNDDRCARALERLFEADGAALLTTLVMHTVLEFAIELEQLHNDSTTITFHGSYTSQRDVAEEKRPPRIARGHNKDHRPDLKQLLYCVTVSADGAVPIHFKTYDGNTADDSTHVETWEFLKRLVGDANFLYVADCKLCSHENLGHIDKHNGRFLTVVPKTRKETDWMRQYVQEQQVAWEVVRQEVKIRGKSKRQGSYEGFEYPKPCSDGYRLLWYRSSVKREDEAAARARRLKKFRAWQKGFAAKPKRCRFAKEDKAWAAGQVLVKKNQVAGWVRPRVEKRSEVRREQVGSGRPGPNTVYEERVLTLQRYVA